MVKLKVNNIEMLSLSGLFKKYFVTSPEKSFSILREQISITDMKSSTSET